ncbi:hypothetical protein F4804DRAFT_328921 [Jackrogersella minutella]|nr:hypothetical protein F4804DRAFT_328921 [Jackrogersella minutella]
MKCIITTLALLLLSSPFAASSQHCPRQTFRTVVPDSTTFRTVQAAPTQAPVSELAGVVRTTTLAASLVTITEETDGTGPDTPSPTSTIFHTVTERGNRGEPSEAR